MPINNPPVMKKQKLNRKTMYLSMLSQQLAILDRKMYVWKRTEMKTSEFFYQQQKCSSSDVCIRMSNRWLAAATVNWQLSGLSTSSQKLNKQSQLLTRQDERLRMQTPNWTESTDAENYPTNLLQPCQRGLRRGKGRCCSAPARLPPFRSYDDGLRKCGINLNQHSSAHQRNLTCIIKNGLSRGPFPIKSDVFRLVLFTKRQVYVRLEAKLIVSSTL